MDDEATLKAERDRMRKGVDLDALVAGNAARKREIVAGDAASLTPSEREAQGAYLAALATRANAGPGYVTDYHRNLMIAERDRVEYERSIGFLAGLTPEEYPDLDAAKQAELETSIEAFRVNLAAAYFTLGEFQKAAEIYPERDRTLDHYHEYLVAEQNIDGPACACPRATEHEEADATGTRYRVENMTQTIEGRFPSPRLNVTLYAIRCVHADCQGPSLTLRTAPTAEAQRDLAATQVKEAPWQALAPSGCDGCEPAAGRTLEQRYEEFYAANPHLRPRRG